MNKQQYSAWLQQFFPKSEMTTLGKYIEKCNMVEVLFINEADESFQLLDTKALEANIVKSSDAVFFSQYDHFSVGSKSMRLQDFDVLIDWGDKSSVAVFYNDNTVVDSYSDIGTLVIRTGQESIALFLSWYLSLDVVVSEIDQSCSDSWSRIESLPMPSMDYVDNELLMKALKEVGVAENRIARNAKEMMVRLRTMRESIVHDIPLVDSL